MSDEVNIKLAQSTFQTICEAFDARELHYTPDAEELTVECSFRGEDLPMDIEVRVDAKRDLVVMISHLPFSVKTDSDKITDMTVAINYINNALIDGNFDYSIEKGRILYRIALSYRGSLIAKAAFMYLVDCGCSTISEYNEKLFMLAKGLITIQQFFDMLNEDDEEEE